MLIIFIIHLSNFVLDLRPISGGLYTAKRPFNLISGTQ